MPLAPLLPDPADQQLAHQKQTQKMEREHPYVNDTYWIVKSYVLMSAPGTAFAHVTFGHVHFLHKPDPKIQAVRPGSGGGVPTGVATEVFSWDLDADGLYIGATLALTYSGASGIDLEFHWSMQEFNRW